MTENLHMWYSGKFQATGYLQEVVFINGENLKKATCTNIL